MSHTTIISLHTMTRFFLLRMNRIARNKMGYSPFSSWLMIPVCLFLFAILIPLSAYGDPSTLQTLDNVQTDLLASGCARLGGNSVAFGPDLQTICENATVSTVANGGGAGASSQSSAASVLNSVLLKRARDFRDTEEKSDSGKTTFNLGNGVSLFLLEGLGDLNVASPMSPNVSNTGAVNISLERGRLFKGVSVFASGIFESLDRDITTFQDGYDSTIGGLSVGADYQLNKKVFFGLAFTLTKQTGNFEGGGDFETISYDPILFASFLPTDEIFIEVAGSYTRTNYDINRAATYTTAAGDPITSGRAFSDDAGDGFHSRIQVGYDYRVKNLTIGPRLGLNYSNTHIFDYEEKGNTGLELRYDDQWINSFQSVVGLFGSMALSTSMGVFVPQVTADYIHEFANSQRFITVQFAQDNRANLTRFQFQNEVSVRNFFNFGAGMVAVLPHGVQPFVNFRAMVGNEQFDNYAGSFGVRVEL